MDGEEGEFRSFQGKNPNPAARPISEPAEEKKGDVLSSLEVNKQRPRLIESAALCSEPLSSASTDIQDN